jgi:hypothetical protein
VRAQREPLNSELLRAEADADLAALDPRCLALLRWADRWQLYANVVKSCQSVNVHAVQPYSRQR